MSESVNGTTFLVTDKAKEYILEIMEENQIPEEYFLKISAKTGEHDGFAYQLGFDREQSNGDTLFEFGNIKISVDGKSLFYLMDAELDYKNDSNGKGFTFNNPNKSPHNHSSCGCSI